MRLPSFNVRPERVVWLAAFYAATVLNIPFWKRLWIALTPDTAFDWAVLAVLLVDLTVILAFIFGVFAFRRIFKPVVAILFLLMAASSYYMLEFGAVIDRDMLRNVIETDVGEARDLISLPFMLFIATLGLFPALIVARCEMAPRPFWQELRFRALASVLSLATVAVVTYPFVGTLFSIFREHAIIRHEVSPINMIDANIGYVRQVTAVGRKAVARPVITASRTNAWDHRASKTVFVVVLGETARAQNFSLNGYDRKTNPELEKIPGLVSFSKAYSCGTATAASVPCMFSSLGRLGYTPAKAASSPNLIDVLDAAKFKMTWRDNQSGCKGVCRAISSESLVPEGRLAEDHISYDDRLIENLDAWIDALDRPGVLFLHMMGSHGPAYFRRYPSSHALFKPDCQDTRFSHCDTGHIVNAYDNTIAYTDHVLAELIRKLDARAPAVSSAVLYVSDHGESLGEKNLYLHGMPYNLAPDTQKRVPFIFWASKAFATETALNLSCLDRRKADAISHDNLFHSVLGLLDIATEQYQKKLDLFAACRANEAAGHNVAP